MAKKIQLLCILMIFAAFASTTTARPEEDHMESQVKSPASSDSDHRKFPGLEFGPGTPETKPIDCPTGYYPECQRSKCFRKRGRSLDADNDHPYVAEEEDEEYEGDGSQYPEYDADNEVVTGETRFSKNMGCTSSKACPDNYTCRCTKSSCVLVTDQVLGPTGMQSCRCPCTPGPCPSPCINNLVCTESCTNKPECE